LDILWQWILTAFDLVEAPEGSAPVFFYGAPNCAAELTI
jgi:hypothetical protein